MTELTNKPSNRGLDLEDTKLDALLRAAKPTSDAAREAALLDRIMTAAERSPRLTVVTSAPVVTPQRPPLRVAEAREVTVQPVTRPRRELMGAAAMLAASLVLGVFLGQSPYALQTVTRIEQATGFTIASASQEVARLLASAEFDEDDMP